MVKNAYIGAEDVISVQFFQEDTQGYPFLNLPWAFPDRAFSNEMAPSHQDMGRQWELTIRWLIIPPLFKSGYLYGFYY